MLCGLPRSVREHLLHRDVQPQEVPEELPPADELPRRVRPLLHPPGTRPLHLATAGIDSTAEVDMRKKIINTRISAMSFQASVNMSPKIDL